MLDLIHLQYVDFANSGQMNIPTPVDQVLDSRILQIFTKIDSVKAAVGAFLNVLGSHHCSYMFILVALFYLWY